VYRGGEPEATELIEPPDRASNSLVIKRDLQNTGDDLFTFLDPFPRVPCGTETDKEAWRYLGSSDVIVLRKFPQSYLFGASSLQLGMSPITTDSLPPWEIDPGKRDRNSGVYSARFPSILSGELLAETTGNKNVRADLYHCSIGKCVPLDETEEGCKARLSRIVAKQKQCYCESPLYESN